MMDHKYKYRMAAKKKYQDMLLQTELFYKKEYSKKKSQSNQNYTKDKLTFDKWDNDTCNQTNNAQK